MTYEDLMRRASAYFLASRSIGDLSGQDPQDERIYHRLLAIGLMYEIQAFDVRRQMLVEQRDKSNAIADAGHVQADEPKQSC